MNVGPFSVVRSWISGNSILAPIAQHYALDSPAMCQLLQVALNDTYLVTAGDTRCIARLYRARRTEAEITYELQLLAHLAAKGAPVSIPIATKDGRLALSLLAPEGVRHLVLFTYAPGIPIAWTDSEQCYLAGQLLATFHAACDDFVSPHERTPMDLSALSDTPLTAIRPYLVHRPQDVAYLEAFTSKLRARLIAAIRTGLDWGVCHGDFDAANVFMGDDKTLEVFDFDRSGPGWRVFDFYHVQKAAARRGAAIWDAFLKGYRGRRSLAEADVNALPLFYVIGRFCKLGTLAENGNEQGIRQFRDDRLDRWMNYFRHSESEYLDHV